VTHEPSAPQRSGYPKRTQAAIAVVFVLALLGVHRLLVSAPERGLDVAAFDRRFAAMRDTLPRGVVGYLSDSDFFGEYYATQYALAPVVVYALPRPAGFARSGSAPILVVGNFNSPARIPDALARNTLILKRDFGGGVLLLEPETR